jgi:large subunit ribosomal protein L9
MYIVLTKDLPGVAQKNSLMNVKKGYFMNYLEPQGFAKVATASLIERLRGTILAQKAAAAEAAKALSTRMKELVGAQITMSAKASGKGTLFKALSAKEVLSALKKQLNLEMSKEQLEMEPMKKVGEHTITVVMGSDSASVKVLVEAKGE